MCNGTIVGRRVAAGIGREKRGIRGLKKRGERDTFWP